MDERAGVRHHFQMFPAAGWMVGWTFAIGGAGLATIVFDAEGGGRWPSFLVLAASAIGGMAYGAYEAARRRRPDDPFGPRRHAVAWALAGGVAFVMGAISMAALPGGDRPENRDFYEHGARLLVWFGAVGGFLAVAAAAEWRLRIWAFVRGLVAAIAWSSLVLFCGAASAVGVSLGARALAGSVGASSPIIAGLLVGAISGLFLGVCGEAVNRRTLKPPG
jgi:hypothetical protein